MDQNTLGQSDCRTCKSTISLKQNDEKVWFFGCWYKFMEINSWLKKFWGEDGQNGYVYSGYKTLKLTVSQKVIWWNKWIFGFLKQVQES